MIPPEIAALPPNGVVLALLRQMTDYEFGLALRDVFWEMSRRQWWHHMAPRPIEE